MAQPFMNLDIAGTAEHAMQMNEQLRNDIEIVHERPFLNRMEKIGLGEYYGTWASNHLIGLLPFDEDGNYLPQLYMAPTEISRMLYPIDEIINFERQGTLVIDREQYSPVMHNASFFIYMVDKELYDEIYTKQHLPEKERGVRPYMYDPQTFCRVFCDYYALARHLRKQRFVTYVLGPRTMFYMRFYMYQFEVHTVDSRYAYGEKVDPTLAKAVIEVMEQCLAFKPSKNKLYECKLTEDKYRDIRALAERFGQKLPEVKKFESKTTITPYVKYRLTGPARRARVKWVTDRGHVRHEEVKSDYLRDLGVMPYHHVRFSNGYYLFYVWDSRKIQVVVPADKVNPKDLMMADDNMLDLDMRFNPNKPEEFEIVKECAKTLTIQLHRNPSTVVKRSNS